MTIKARSKPATSPTLQPPQLVCKNMSTRNSDTYTGKRPITPSQPTRVPQRLNNPESNLYALLFIFVKTWASCSEMPGGRAFLTLLVLPVGVPSILVAGTYSKYGSYDRRSASCKHIRLHKLEIFETYLRTKIVLRIFLKYPLENEASHDGRLAAWQSLQEGSQSRKK